MSAMDGEDEDGIILIDAGPISVDALTDGTDPILQSDLVNRVGSLDLCKFRLVEIPLTVLAESIYAPEDYLADGAEAGEEGYASAQDFADAYAKSRYVPPTVVRRASRGYVMIDGFHRLCGANAARCVPIRAYEFVEPPTTS